MILTRRFTPGVTMSEALRRPTLRISRQVLESFPAFVVYHLDQLKVAQAMRQARLLMLQKGMGVVRERADLVLNEKGHP